MSGFATQGSGLATRVGCMLMCAAGAMAQRGPAQPVSAPRALGPVVAQTAQTFAGVPNVFTVRGGVFVHDAGARQIWLFDTALRNPRVVLDSTSGLGRETFYGAGIGLPVGVALSDNTLHRFKGDSIFYTPWERSGPTSATIAAEGLVIGPEGRVARIAASPVANVGCPVGHLDDTGWYLCQSNLAYTWEPNVDMGDSVMSRGRADSSALLSVSFKTWDVDTLAVRLTTFPRTQLGFSYKMRNGARSSVVTPVIFISDAWTTFRDGTLAIVRGADYHVDIVDVRGQVTKGPRAPFDWRRITDDDRTRMVDSIRRADSVTQHRVDSVAAATPPRIAPDGTILPPLVRGVQDHTPPDEWPSYWPPLKTWWNGAPPRVVMTDEDGRVWVDERQPPGGDTISVYGVFDRKGQFVDRVKVPASQTVLAFGPAGMVYLKTVDGGRTTILMRRFR